MKRRRTTPYTRIGIARVPCARCGAPSAHQWQACADGGAYRGICESCDIALNRLVLKWMRDPDWKSKIDTYRRRYRSS